MHREFRDMKEAISNLFVAEGRCNTEGEPRDEEVNQNVLPHILTCSPLTQISAVAAAHPSASTRSGQYVVHSSHPCIV
jgi:hypothetical protein